MDRDHIALLATLNLWPKSSVAQAFSVDRTHVNKILKTRRVVDECKHGMVSEWCAICKGIKDPEEEHDTDGFWDRVIASKESDSPEWTL